MSSKYNKLRITWDGWSIEHIKKHSVNMTEVREAIKSNPLIKVSYFDRQVIYGTTKKNRFLTVVLSFEQQKEGYVVSARDMSSKERQIYNYEKTKTNKAV